ncbi:MAG TPA: protein kinase [Gaiellaceae bacterium]|nr:protein kinase [Gaiellaceae bacterium]
MVGELIAGRYELEQLVGAGGMSSVFRAHDSLLERTVALKILHEQFSRDEDYVERFRREARSVAQLAHPNIVTVIDRGEQDGRQFIVFEYVDGANLKERCRGGALPLDEVLDVAIQTARALAFAHDRGIVHRDVKPQNVLLDDEGQAKVTDFGIARSLDVQGVTQTGTVLGTSDYIAPEQARGERVSPKTDIYSLGAVLYELLTGEVPYPGDNFVAIAMRHVHDPVPSVLDRRPDCPSRLDSVVRRAMAKDPDERFESMNDLLGELEACRAELAGRSDDGATFILPREAVRPARKPRPRLRVGWAPVLTGLAILALAAAAVGLLFVDGGGNGLPGVNPPPPAQNVRLAGIGTEDPAGDGEHDDEVGDATDGDPATYWTTEDYRSFDKPGVGLVLDAERPVALGQLTVTSELSGFPAVIRASSNPTSGFQEVSTRKEVGEETTFDVNTNGKQYRFYEIWLQLPNGGRARINEVRAKT